MNMKQQRNIERLIARCESILSGKTNFTGQEWKLSKYVVALDQQIKELERSSIVDPDLLKSFQQRVSVLREVLRNEDEPQGVFSTSVNSSFGVESPLSSSSHHPLSSSLHSTRGNELLMRAGNKKLAALREQLFGMTDGDDSGDTSLRQRREGGDDLEKVLRHHEEVQEELARDMIKMAQSLKRSSLAAKNIIASDNVMLKETTDQADKNIDAINKETDRLRKHNSRCNWGIWALLFVVFAVFIAMVIFIRVVPKPRS